MTPSLSIYIIGTFYSLRFKVVYGFIISNFSPFFAFTSSYSDLQTDDSGCVAGQEGRSPETVRVQLFSCAS